MCTYRYNRVIFLVVSSSPAGEDTRSPNRQFTTTAQLQDGSPLNGSLFVNYDHRVLSVD
ncbi:hypothetical protein WN48_08887 [Eufriesea mexicana]|uniref:Uncharacterized protein n=1 Tax=Eufriesea mexicana TaxID=516756 RepID=A0A310SLE5_9HYME|nr:hypothetical protein WN48_08887 [Eufriesea mexicana]